MIVSTVSTALVLTVAASFFMGDQRFSRLWFAAGWAFSVLGLVGWRWVTVAAYAALRQAVVPARKVLIVGANPVGREIARDLARGSRVVGYVDNGSDLDEDVALVGPIASLERLVQLHGIDEIVVALPPNRREQLGRIIARGFGRPVQVKFAAELGELLPERFELHRHGGRSYIGFAPVAPVSWLKRAFDLRVRRTGAARALTVHARHRARDQAGLAGAGLLRPGAGRQGRRALPDVEVPPFFHCLTAELAVWEGRTADAATAVDHGRLVATSPDLAKYRTQLCAMGLRAEADRAQLAAARDAGAVVDDARRRAARLLAEARSSAREAVVGTPDAEAWTAVAEAEYGRVEARAEPELWLAAADAWDRLDRPYPTAYCRWRYAEALLSGGPPATDPLTPARAAYRVASRLGARPLQGELELLAQRARLNLVEPGSARSPGAYDGLGLSPREREVLGLLACGYTNRQIASQLTISVKTASVHVSHILSKLGVAHRIEAAAIAQRLQPLGG